MAYRLISENRFARFMSLVEVDAETNCWNWVGCKTKGGYGASALNGIKMVAHRAMWRLLRGELPDGLDLDHLCRNRSCINPDHLEPVTRSENLKRGFEARGCKNGHSYNDRDFDLVKRSDGSVERRCKICHRERNRRAKHNRRLREGRV
jgi:hypothetical protein